MHWRVIIIVVTSENHIAIHWRVNSERLKLVGCKCENCSNKIFPPRPICPHCDYEVTAQFLGTGTVKAILDHKESPERDIELLVSKKNEKYTVRIGLNGKSHSIGLEVGMELPVFVRKSLRGEKPIYTIEATSSSSK